VKLTSLRSARLVVSGQLDREYPSSQLTAFIGLYNADAYLPRIFAWIEAQTVDRPILLVDNGSVDTTWATIMAWSSRLNRNVKLVRNPMNLGATGSLYLNLDLVTTPWVSTIHQDDEYENHHLDVQLAGIIAASENCICVVTDMGSLTVKGRLSARVPRSSWFLPDSDPETLFVTNLRLHNVPFPAAAFRVEALSNSMVPWHSNSMPDTEWVLRNVGKGKITFIPIVTMYYRENPLSESHALAKTESQIGTYMSLSRAVNSEVFAAMVSALPERDRQRFAEAIFEGLNARISNIEHLRLIRLSVAEQLALAWDYSEPNSLSEIRAAYGELGPSRIGDLITELERFYKLSNSGKKDSSNLSRTAPEVKAGFGNHFFQRLLAACYAITGLLPYGFRRKLLKALTQGSRGLAKGSPWHFNWRKP
jgi:glycosyltransferase involved in cell wall biosynthesis